ncbi:MAG: DUF58 domain-containing protein [Anaerolineae bacterium]|jgi:uncharacterized protein (DUF58 family)|nr:DUF58 domain-containing protein [Anaerolineae bacterium]
MLTPELLRRIRRIELRTRRLVHNAFAGAYHSRYKGRGLAFSSVRPYVPGDDVRAIDWKVTARTGEPFIRQYVEERELTVMLVLDGSASVLFGTVDRQKRDFAAELGAILAYAAISNQDKVGLLIFSDHIEHYIPPRKGRKHILRLIRDLLLVETSGRGTDMGQALQTVNRLLPAGAIVFIISDFLMDSAAYARQLALTAQQHDTIVMVLRDPLEETIPAVGLLLLRDAETGAVQAVDTSSAAWQQAFRQQRAAFVQERAAAFRRAGVSEVDLPPDGDVVRALTRFFRQGRGR